MMPKRTWWMKQHDTINLSILGVILVLIVWGSLSRPMSTEGARIIAKGAVIIYLVTAAMIFQRLIGQGQRRRHVMLAGTLVGFALGVLAGYPLSDWLENDTSVISVCAGLTLG
jgi:hypothetical protein